MKASTPHIQLNVSDVQKSIPFYKDLFTYLEYNIISENPKHIGASNGTVDVWITETGQEYKKNLYHRKNTGMNHLAFKVSSKEDVDKFFKEFLQSKNIPTLYNTPKEFPEYHEGYYAVFFEDPDRIKLELLFIP